MRTMKNISDSKTVLSDSVNFVDLENRMKLARYRVIDPVRLECLRT